MAYYEIWQASKSYMEARQNNIHIPVCYHFAEQLVEAYPDCDKDVVLLGILLHDLGWASVDADEINAKMLSVRVSDARILHEKEGERIAREILEAHSYPVDMIDEICAIIDGHDTRLEALSLNDKLVKDADKLWRFSSLGITVASGWFDWTPARFAQRVESKDMELVFTDKARELAASEMAKSKAILQVDNLT